MAEMATSEEATQTGPVDERPRLLSVDALTSDYLSSLSLLVWVWIAANTAPVWSALALGAYTVWVIGDLVIYRIRHRTMPPRPTWGRHSRWTVPLYFLVLIIRAIQGI